MHRNGWSSTYQLPQAGVFDAGLLNPCSYHAFQPGFAPTNIPRSVLAHEDQPTLVLPCQVSQFSLYSPPLVRDGGSPLTRIPLSLMTQPPESKNRIIRDSPFFFFVSRASIANLLSRHVFPLKCLDCFSSVATSFRSAPDQEGLRSAFTTVPASAKTRIHLVIYTRASLPHCGSQRLIDI